MMHKKGDRSFKEPRCVGKLKDLESALRKIDAGGSEDQLTKQENSWILKAVQCYKLPLKLTQFQGTSNEEDVDETHEDTDPEVVSTALSRTVVVDASELLVIRKHPLTPGNIEEIAVAIKGCRIQAFLDEEMIVQTEALFKRLPERLARIMEALSAQVRFSWPIAFFRENVHQIAQILSLAGHVIKNVESSSCLESMLKPVSGDNYSEPLRSESLKNLQRVALYHDH